MIRSRDDFKHYLKADGLIQKSGLRNILFNDIRKFMILLRKAEYYNNCRTKIIGNIIAGYYRFGLNRQGIKLGFTIPINVFGPGLSIAHHGTISVSPNARVGANCRIHVCVNIGVGGSPGGAPRIGNNVYIAPGAKLFGDIEIADGIAVGANAVVNKSFSEEGISIGGVPARKLGDGGAANAGWLPYGRNPS